MSFCGYKEEVSEGDLVVLYLGFNSMHAVTVTACITNKQGQLVDNVMQTSYGALRVKDLVGLKFGHKVQMTRGYGYILHPSPELWTKTLPHRTQILYATDISLIILQLQLRPGSVVVESGTGSGSLAHSLIRTVAPSGHLFTFDFHQVRVDLATEEFRAHQLQHLVTVTHRDVCADGFGLTNVADAVFLDLPHPWKAVSHAKDSIKDQGGRICSFSPCIEQVSRTAAKLKELGFIEISTMECLLREFQVRSINQSAFDPEFKGSSTTNGDDCPPHEADQAQPQQPSAGIKRKLDSELKTSPVDICLQKKFVTGVPCLKMAGHTGFLTFATLPPKSVAKL